MKKARRGKAQVAIATEAPPRISGERQDVILMERQRLKDLRGITGTVHSRRSFASTRHGEIR